MRMCLFSCILCFVIASPALSELTPQDLDKIRLIVNEEVKEEITLVKTELKEYIDLKITNVEKRFEARFDGIDVRFKGIDDKFKAVDDRFKGIEGQIALTINLVYALIALIVAALAIPQILIAWRGRLDTTRDRNVEELARKISEQAEEIEMLKQQRTVKS